MAGNGNRSGFDRNAAEDLVFSNMGLDAADLGVDDNRDGLDDDAEPRGRGQGGQGDDDDFDDELDGGGADSSLDGQLDAIERQDRGRQQQRGKGKPTTFREGLDDLSVTHTPFRKAAEVRADKNGNLVDKITGRVVAKAGREARLYQGQSKARHEAAQAQARATDLETKLRRAIELGRQALDSSNEFKANTEKYKEFGLNPDQTLIALSLFRQLEKDPAGTLKRLLTRAAANGINVQGGTQGGSDGSGSLFGTQNQPALMDVIQEAISKAMKPLQDTTARTAQERQAQEQEERTRNEVQAEVHTFFGQNPAAVRYASVFENMLRSPEYRGKPMSELWLAIQLNLARRGSNGSGQRRNLPSGGGRPSGRSMAPMGDPDGMAPVTDTYDSILRDILTQHDVR